MLHSKFKGSLFIIIMLGITLLAVLDLKNHLVIYIANQDKYLHLITFSALFLLARFVFKALAPYKIALLLFLFGLLLEIMQELFSAGARHFHGLDLLFNMLGIAVAWLVVGMVYPRLRRH